MLELLTYQNNEGEVLISSSKFGQPGLYVEDSELRNFSWNVLSINEKITGFNRKQIKTYSLPCKIRCITEEQGRKFKERLYRIAEKDILANKAGRLWIAGYYMYCFVTESKKENYRYTQRCADITLTLTTDKPYWVKEVTYQFRKKEAGHDGYDFPLDFPMNLGTEFINGTIQEADFPDADFRIKIFGPVENPAISINNHLYKVNYQINEGNFIIIDSLKKTLVQQDAYGNEESILFYRDTSSYIFEKINTKNSDISWDNTFNFDLTIYLQRSEPTWEMDSYVRDGNGTDVSGDVYVNGEIPPTDLLSADDRYY
jgi:hypothetical protein